MLSKNTIWDWLYIKLAKLINFKKKSSFFPKTPPVFPRNSKVWNFWEFSSKNTIWDSLYRNIANVSHFKKIKQFFEFTHLLSRKSQAVERFEFYWAIRVFERHSKERYPCLAFLKTFKCFLEKKHLFPKTQHFERLQNTWA